MLCPWRQKEASPATKVCELPIWVLGTRLWSSLRIASALNHLTTLFVNLLISVCMCEMGKRKYACLIT